VCIKGKPHKYGIKMFELCETKISYVYNLDAYTGAHPTQHFFSVCLEDLDMRVDSSQVPLSVSTYVVFCLKVCVSNVVSIVTEHNLAFSVVNRLCDKIKGKGHCVYMDRWFSSPKIVDHLWGCKTEAVSTVMSNSKEMPKQTFSGKLKEGEKISCQWDHLSAIKWKDIRGLFLNRCP
jgi:hypothetical protein